MVDKSGKLLVSYVYTAYGVPTTSFPGITSSMSASEKQEIYILGNNNAFRYRGYYYDVETGFYYLNSRYYDPVTGRFLNADGLVSTGQGILGQNMFAYCANNPVNLVDPSGECYYDMNGIFMCGYEYIEREMCDGRCGNPYSCSVCSVRMQYSLCRERFWANEISSSSPYIDVTEAINTKLNSVAAQASMNKTVANSSFGVAHVVGEMAIYKKFYNMVNHNEEWDIKVPDSWRNTVGTSFPGTDVKVMFNGELMTPEALGNYTYGFIGAAFGIPISTLYVGSYYAAGFPISRATIRNEFTDWKYITKGYCSW